jgi:hypothetical protein
VPEVQTYMTLYSTSLCTNTGLSIINKGVLHPGAYIILPLYHFRRFDMIKAEEKKQQHTVLAWDGWIKRWSF